MITAINRVKDMSNAVYHGHKEHISSTALRTILTKSLKHYKYGLENPEPVTAAMEFGSAYHSLILEPVAFYESYFFLDPSKKPNPNKDYRDGENKKWKDAKVSENSGRTLLTTEIWEQLHDMAKALQTYEGFAFILRDGIAEESFFGEFDGMPVRVRPDYLTQFGIVDLKTTTDASPEGFGKIIANSKYHVQAALYSDVIAAFTGEVLPFFFLAQEKTAPFVAQMYLVPEWLIEQGRYEYREALHSLRIARETDVWTAYQGEEERDGIRDVVFPRWAVREVLS